MENTFTQILAADDPDGIGEDVWVCCDCGAHGPTTESIQHHSTCIPGDAERWAKYYADWDMDNNDDS